MTTLCSLAAYCIKTAYCTLERGPFGVQKRKNRNRKGRAVQEKEQEEDNELEMGSRRAVVKNLSISGGMSGVVDRGMYRVDLG